jgi:hypothetical protein
MFIQRIDVFDNFNGNNLVTDAAHKEYSAPISALGKTGVLFLKVTFDDDSGSAVQLRLHLNDPSFDFAGVGAALEAKFKVGFDPAATGDVLYNGNLEAGATVWMPFMVQSPTNSMDVLLICSGNSGLDSVGRGICTLLSV